MLATKYINGKAYRCGYTTGSCAAAAAKAAASMLLRAEWNEQVTIQTPAGIELTLDVLEQQNNVDSASCCIVKDAGDDPDVTNGAEVHATVRRIPDISPGNAHRITIEGGKGIGRVTKPGLAVPPGEWAINPVPRQMIESAVSKVLSPTGSLNVTISIPDGEERAEEEEPAQDEAAPGIAPDLAVPPGDEGEHAEEQYAHPPLHEGHGKG